MSLHISFSPHHYAQAQTRGGRAYQEDSLAHQFGDGETTNSLAPRSTADTAVMVLADGMGGENAGDHASQLAVSHFLAGFNAAPQTPMPQRLRGALDQANRAIADAVAADPALQGMGCTLVALAVAADKAHFISVGDSPLWHYRHGIPTRLNADHSMGGILDEVARRGEITQAMANESPHRHVLVSALTGEAIEHISETDGSISLLDGDVLLAASDGLLSLPAATRDQLVATSATADDCAHGLIAAVEALGMPEQDNTSVQLLFCQASRPFAHRWWVWLLAAGLGIGVGAGLYGLL